MAATGLAVTASVGSYLAFYTAYDKKTKTLNSQNVTDVLLGAKGVDHTLVQLNKVLALSGLTQLALVFMPGADSYVDTDQLRLASTVMLVAHAGYSAYRYYDSAKIPRLSTFTAFFDQVRSEKPIEKLLAQRKVSLVLGAAAINLLEAWALMQAPYGLTPKTSGLLVLSLSTLHFYFIEVDVKGGLPVRPYGYLAFLSAGISGAAGLTVALMNM